MHRCKEDHLLQADLLSRGWTRSLITQFLQGPDLTRRNPRCFGGPVMKLYARERVEAVEKREDYRAALERVARRRSAARAGGQRRVAKLLEEMESIPISIPLIEIDDLVGEATRSHNTVSRQSFASVSSDPLFLERVVRNHLRHRCTPYDKILASLSGCPGCEEAYEALRDRIEWEIDLQYPGLRADIEEYQARGLQETLGAGRDRRGTRPPAASRASNMVGSTVDEQ